LSASFYPIASSSSSSHDVISVVQASGTRYKVCVTCVVIVRRNQKTGTSSARRLVVLYRGIYFILISHHAAPL